MPTTYTSLLGLALPATGELSGTWGTTVNTEITSLLDTAIAGTTTLSTDADVTLSTTTGAANQARQAIILWTANGTVTRNITAPAASKTYVVINASAGTQSIVFRGVGPTAGVTVVKGESAVVAWNGSDFIKVSNTSGAGAFTNLSVSGTTTLSGLTASTALALDASKNVVSVTNTGTGNNVLATSPVLTTPNLGTPSAATLTNATGLPVSTGISGLGTGVATALAVNTGAAGAFVVNGGALGTPSSGTVTNLTGTASININGTVGATTPNTGAFTTLSASGVATFSAGTAAAPALTTTGDTDTGVFFPATNTWAVATGAFERLRITSAGAVGIGMTPATTLDVQGDITARGASISSTAYINMGTAYTAAYLEWVPGSSQLTIMNSQAGPLRFATNNGERMRIDSSGNVGIGTAFPSLRLTVVDTNNQLSINNATNELIVRANSTEAALYTFQAIPLNFYTNNQERMRIDSSGNVGIGTTNPLQPLDVVGIVRSTGTGSSFALLQGGNADGAGIRLCRAGSASQNAYITQFQGSLFVKNVDSGAIIFTTTTSDTERMRITSAGLVGIGTITPDALLTVNGVASFGAGSSALPSIARFGALDTGVWFPSTTTVAVSIGGGERFRVTSLGVRVSGGSVYLDDDNFTQWGTSDTASIIGKSGSGTTGYIKLSVNGEIMRIKSSGQVRLMPNSGTPAGAENGDLYYDSSTNKFRGYANGTWVDLH